MKRSVFQMTLGLAAMLVILVGLESQANAFGSHGSRGSCGSHGGLFGGGSRGSHGSRGGLFHRNKALAAVRPASRRVVAVKRSRAVVKRSMKSRPADVKAAAIVDAVAVTTVVTAAGGCNSGCNGDSGCGCNGDSDKKEEGAAAPAPPEERNGKKEKSA